MTGTSIYLLTTPGNSSIEISQDEVRTLLSEIESQLHQSKVYRRALGALQKLLGSTEQADVLFKLVGREAIGLAFRQFTEKQEKIAETQQIDEKSEVIAALQPVESAELAESSNSIKLHQESVVTTSEIDSHSEFDVILDTSDDPVKAATKDSFIKVTPKQWFKLNKKPSQAELAQTAAEKRIETLRQIGQQLRQARESQGLSLSQLNVYTHVQITYMEAIENGNWELLPDEVYVRGYIRVMGNSLGLNGSTLAGALPAPSVMKSLVPPQYQIKNSGGFGGFGLAVRPVHLYIGYTALVAGAFSGLSMISQQQTNADRLLNKATITPPSSSFAQSLKDKKTTVKPALQSNTAGVSVGHDISPPEAL
ncbi:MAG: helix-turn-helix domain-containing protein [Rhizonema sp. NSF051]|nr:helix-turn-helix domain-containing protein [Rhizonema sp. NSF051]